MAEPSAHTYDPTYFRAQGWWRDETLGGWLERCAASRGDHAAVMIGRQSFSYENLKAHVTAFASGLHRIGIAPGDVVAVLEAMKMQNDIVATSSGRVLDVHVKEGDVVAPKQPLVTVR